MLDVDIYIVTTGKFRDITGESKKLQSLEKQPHKISEFVKNLYRTYNWFDKEFLSVIKSCFEEFWNTDWDFKLFVLSEEVSPLSKGEDYFVTRVALDKTHNVTFKLSQSAVQILMHHSLGEEDTFFEIENLTELEAKIFSSFNEFIFKKISKHLIPIANADKKKLRDTDSLCHLLIYFQNNFEETGKLLISLPIPVLNPVKIEPEGEKFSLDFFKNTQTEVNIKVGSAIITLRDLKALAPEDIVVLEQSNIRKMQLSYEGFITDFKVNPEPGLILNIEENTITGENTMENPLKADIWDNIQVEVGAEFEKVKISLGELKQISDGLVLDLGSVYKNQIKLSVEDKIIAEGELVIVNDRYGVKLNRVYAELPSGEEIAAQNAGENSENTDNTAEEDLQTEESQEEDFDYSDFEIEEENI